MARYLVLTLLLAALGCSQGPGPHKKTVYPNVKLQVFVDGKPVEKVHVTLHPFEKDEPKVWRPYRPHGFSDKDGLVVFTTYFERDGVPAGEYRATVDWEPPPGVTIPGTGPMEIPDRFRKKYVNPLKNSWKFTVKRNAIEPDRLELEAPPE